jgi:hypothetical protein
MIVIVPAGFVVAVLLIGILVGARRSLLQATATTIGMLLAVIVTTSLGVLITYSVKIEPEISAGIILGFMFYPFALYSILTTRTSTFKLWHKVLLATFATAFFTAVFILGFILQPIVYARTGIEGDIFAIFYGCSAVLLFLVFGVILSIKSIKIRR